MFRTHLNLHYCKSAIVNLFFIGKCKRLKRVFAFVATLLIVYNVNTYAQNINSATNGLSKTNDTTVGMGGTLMQNTDIDLGGAFKMGYKKGSLSYLSISNNGNVGLGIANPLAQFHTTGSIRFDLFKNNADRDSLITTDADGNLVFKSMASFVYPSGGLIYDGSGLRLGGQLSGYTQLIVTGDPHFSIESDDGRSINMHREEEGREWLVQLKNQNSEIGLERNNLTLGTRDFSLGNWSSLQLGAAQTRLGLSLNGGFQESFIQQGEDGGVYLGAAIIDLVQFSLKTNVLRLDNSGFAFSAGNIEDFVNNRGPEKFSVYNNGTVLLAGYPNNPSEDQILTTDQSGFLKLKTVSSTLNASNGLTSDASGIKLGGTLDTNTQISILDHSFRLRSAGTEDSVFMNVGFDEENGRHFSAFYQGKDDNNFDVTNKLFLGKHLGLTFEGGSALTHFYLGGPGLELATYNSWGSGVRNSLTLDSTGGGILAERSLGNSAWLTLGGPRYSHLNDYLELGAQTGGEASLLKMDSTGFNFQFHSNTIGTFPHFKIRHNGRLWMDKYRNSINGDSVLTTDTAGNLKLMSLSSVVPSLAFTNGLVRSNDTVSIGGYAGEIYLAAKGFHLDVYDSTNLNGNSALHAGPGYATLSAFRDWEPSNTESSIELNPHFGDFSYFDKRNYYKHSLELHGNGLMFGKKEDLGDGYVFSRRLFDINITDNSIKLGDDQMGSLFMSPWMTTMNATAALFLRGTDYSSMNINQAGFDMQFPAFEFSGKNSLRMGSNGFTYGTIQDQEGGPVFTNLMLHINAEGRFTMESYRNNETEDSVLTTDANGNLKFKAISFSGGGGADSAWAYDSIHIYNRNEGNVGIGTLNPTSKFHTLGSVRFESFKNNLQGDSVLTTDAEGNLQFVYMPYGSGGGGGEGYHFANGLIQNSGNVSLGGMLEDSVKIDLAGYQFQLINGAEKLWNIAPSGSVGIGTGASDYRLTVGGDMTVGIPFDSAGAGQRFHFNGYGNTDGLWMARYNTSPDVTELRMNIGDDGGPGDKLHIGHFQWDNLSLWKTSFVVQANGQVGIGTAEVNSDLTVGTGHGNKLTVGNYQWGKVNILTTGWDAGNNDYTDLLVPGLETNTALIRLNKAGNVGIGTLTPDANYRLSVNGKIRAKGLRVQSSGWADFVFEPDYKLMTLPELEKFIRHKKHLPGIATAAEVLREGNDVGETQVILLQKIEELTLYIIELNKQVKDLEDKNKKLESQQSQIGQLQQQLDDLRKLILNK